MNLSEADYKKNEILNTNEFKSDFSFSSPSIPLSTSVSGSNVTKPKHSKSRKHPSSVRPKSSPSEVFESLINPEKSHSLLDLNLKILEVKSIEKNEPFMFGVNQSEKLNFGSSGNVIDEMMELKTEEETNNDEAGKRNLNANSALDSRGFEYEDNNSKNLSTDKSGGSQDIRELNVGITDHNESVDQKNDGPAISSIKTENLNDKVLQNVGEPTDTEFTLDTIMPVKENTPKSSILDVHFQPSVSISEPLSINVPINKDGFQFTTKQDSPRAPHLKNTRSKKGKRNLRRQHILVQVSLGPLADNWSSGNSIASDDSFNLDESIDSSPKNLNDAVEDGLYSAARSMNISSNIETANSFEDEHNLSINFINQESGGAQISSTSAQVTAGANFVFGSNSSGQDQVSAFARQYRKKSGLKDSPSENVFTFSEITSLLPSTHSQIGEPTYRRSSDFEVKNKEPEIKQVATPTSASAIAAQEACEKWRLRGNQSYSKGDLNKADEYYTNGVNCVSQSETSRSCLRVLMLCYSNRAATRMTLGRVREAIDDCKLAAVIDPNFFKVHIRAANCYMSLGEVEEALKYFKKCLQNDVCVDRKIMVEASEGIQKAQKLPEIMSCSDELIRQRITIDAESVLSEIDEALLICPQSEKLLEMKAESLFLLRKYEEVIQLCKQSLDFAKMNCLPLPSDSSVPSENFLLKNWRFSLIFKSYFYLGKLEEAQDFVEKQNGLSNGSEALESAIPFGVVQELLKHKGAGNDAFQSGKHEEAIKHYTSALTCSVESRPFAAICFCNRAAAYKSLGQITDAIADCSLAIALDPKYLKALSRRASLYEMIRDYGQAASDLQRLVALLVKQVEEKTSLSRGNGVAEKDDLRQAQLQLYEMEGEARKNILLNMYLILGIQSSATESEIKKAYRNAARRHHPDKASQSLARNDNGDDGHWKEIAEAVYKDADNLFKTIGEAYAVLSDPIKRERYDLEEETRSAQKKDNMTSPSRTRTDLRNYPIHRTGNTRTWAETRKSFWPS